MQGSGSFRMWDHKDREVSNSSRGSPLCLADRRRELAILRVQLTDDPALDLKPVNLRPYSPPIRLTGETTAYPEGLAYGYPLDAAYKFDRRKIEFLPARPAGTFKTLVSDP